MPSPTSKPPTPPAPPLRLQLFRISIHEPKQLRLGTRPLGPEGRFQLLHQIVHGRPRVEAGQHVWSIGNPQDIGPQGIMFRIGRELTRKVTRRDAQGDFVDEPVVAAGSSHVLLDLALQVAAISKPKDLSTTFEGVGRILAAAMNTDSVVDESGLTIEVAPLRDPTEFIDQLRDAYSIVWLSVTTTLPNHFDVDKDFTQPIENLTRQAGARKATTRLEEGKIEVNDAVEQIVRVASSTGNPAEASIKRSAEAEAERISNKTSNVQLTVTAEELEKDAPGILDRIKSFFSRVRNKNDAPPQFSPGSTPKAAPRTPSATPEPARKKKKRAREARK